MEHPVRLLIIPIAMAISFMCLLLAGWAKAKLPDRPALAEGISTALFWIVMMGAAATGIWIAEGI